MFGAVYKPVHDAEDDTLSTAEDEDDDDCDDGECGEMSCTTTSTSLVDDGNDDFFDRDEDDNDNDDFFDRDEDDNDDCDDGDRDGDDDEDECCAFRPLSLLRFPRETAPSSLDASSPLVDGSSLGELVVNDGNDDVDVLTETEPESNALRG